MTTSGKISMEKGERTKLTQLINLSDNSVVLMGTILAANNTIKLRFS